MDRIFGNGSTSHTTYWKPEPLERGTFGILSTCTVTLGLCVWTAIHLNVPAHGGWLMQRWCKVGWMFLGFLAPEVVAFTAFQQYTAARDLQRKMKEYFPSDSQTSASPNDSKAGETTVEAPQDPAPPDAVRLSQAAKEARRHKWTIVHSYFAAMGGFAVQMADDELNIFPKPDEKKPRLARLTLTPEAIVHLEQKKPGFIPDLSQSFIEDKSKGGTFAKAVVCFQASWFCIQCLTRFIQHLAISLLELNTLGHAICTLMIYVLWWNKPLDIEEPQIIVVRDKDDEEVMQSLAYMCANSKLERQRPLTSTYPSRYSERTLFLVPVEIDNVTGSGRVLYGAPIENQRPSVETRRDILESRKLAARFAGSFWQRLFRRYALDEVVYRLRVNPDMVGQEHTDRFDPKSLSQRFELDKWRDGITLERFGQHYDVAPEEPFVVVPTADCKRWLFAAKMQKFILDSESDVEFNLLVTRIRNFPRFTGIRKQWPLYVGLSFAGFIYGGLHCLAWKAPFPSDIEKMLWRISSVAITATGVLVALVFMWDIAPPLWGRGSASWFDRITDFADEFEGFMGFNTFMSWLEDLEKKPNVPGLISMLATVLWWILALLYLALTALTKTCLDIAAIFSMALYVCGRVYLVVECFINLAHLPESAYELPKWSQYVPHIG